MKRMILSFILPGLLFVLLAGCRGPVEGLAGDYESQGQEHAPARLSLRADGGGALAVGAEEAPFRWEMREPGLLVLHTRQGGSILVRRSDDQLELDLPGAGRLLFRKLP